jgi:exosortase A
MDVIKNKTALAYHMTFLVMLGVWLTIYSKALASMISVWNGSETYTYCYLIVPIVIYLINEKRADLANTSFSSNLLFLIPLFIGQWAFLLSDLAGIAVLTHLAAYGSLVCIVGAVYGMQLIKLLIFPLFFLIFAVPMGEEFVPFLQEVTADISLFLVELVGIPVYREGLYIYIPNGAFEVAEACSGIRFLISMIAIGTLYSYLFYQTIWRRLVFCGLSIFIPIIANGIRAFGIIYVGYKTDMEHAVGADHLVYGWVFFSIVLLLLMAVGKFWREDLTTPEVKPIQLSREVCSVSWLAMLLTFIILLIKPLYQQLVVGQYSSKFEQSSTIKYLEAQAQATFEPVWEPIFKGADKLYAFQDSLKDNPIEIFVAHFNEDNEDKELINWNNRLYNIDKFSLVSQADIKVNDNFQATILNLVTLRGATKQLIYWYQVEKLLSSNRIGIKKAQLINKLKGGNGGGEIVIISFGDTAKSNEDIQTLLTKLTWISNES